MSGPKVLDRFVDGGACPNADETAATRSPTLTNARAMCQESRGMATRLRLNMSVFIRQFHAWETRDIFLPKDACDIITAKRLSLTTLKIADVLW